jgi:hypothetical protein
MHSEFDLHSDTVTRAVPEVLEQYSRVRKFAPIFTETDLNSDRSNSPATETLEPVTESSILVSTSLASSSKAESEILITSTEPSGPEIYQLISGANSVISPDNPQTGVVTPDPNQTSGVVTQEQRTVELREMRHPVSPQEMAKGISGHPVDPQEVTKDELGLVASNSSLGHPIDPQAVLTGSFVHPVDPESMAVGSLMRPVNPQVTKKGSLGQLVSAKENKEGPGIQPHHPNHLSNETAATTSQQTANNRDITRN